jgi:D-serine deaminase-like pyridoxal phosphate-dependent protein
MVMRRLLGIVFACCSVIVFLLKPRNRGKAHDGYFAAINDLLKQMTDGTPRIFCDLDRLDRNIARVMENTGSPERLRIVVKSLPCMSLIKYIMDKTGTKKLMCIHVPFIPAILDELGYDVDILMGKPVSVKTAENFFQNIGQKEKAARTIQWLVDTPERLLEYRDMAERIGHTIRVNIELNIGLNRGGVDCVEMLHEMMEIIRSNPGTLNFTGFMGYEGHVPHVPALSGKIPAIEKELKKTMDRYHEYCLYASEHFGEIYSKASTFNTGGSGTVRFYHEQFPEKEIATGGAFLRPACYPEVSMEGFVPALFIAAPVIKKPGPVRIPFVEFITPFLTWWNPNLKQSFCIYGGIWAGQFISPPGIDPLKMLNDPPNQNMLPNQTLLSISDSAPLSVGDYIFYWPQQSDAMFQFHTCITIREGAITGEWKTFPFGF